MATDDRGATLCDATCGIGLQFHCERPAGHVPPHRVESYGGMYVSWCLTWFTVDEQERPA